MPFVQGLLAGYGIAIPVGAIAILIINVALRNGLWAGFLAGAGAATVDLLFAALAALAGQLLAPWLAPLASPLRMLSGIVLIALGGYGLAGIWRAKPAAQSSTTPTTAGWRIYVQFIGLTLLNPLTVTYFASLILGGSGSSLVTTLDRVAFVVGAALASFSWQTLLAVFGAVLHRGFSPRLQVALSVVGNLIVAGLGAQVLIRLATG